MIIIENAYCDNCGNNNTKLLESFKDAFDEIVFECDDCGALVYEDGSLYNE